MSSLFPDIVDAETEALEILHGAIDKYQPSAVYALVSGGHDSLCAWHIAMKHPAFTAAVHVNTEIGIEATRQFVRHRCREIGCPLIEMRAPRPPFRDKEGNPWGEKGQTAYEAIVCRWGFPGPYGHTLIYNRLKERCVAKLVREAKVKGRKVLLVTGVRKAESKRRMGYIVPVQEEGTRVWCAPLVNWTNEDKKEYIAKHKLPQNTVVKRMCMSGECTCGAFARPEELAEIKSVDKGLYEYIRGLESTVQSLGLQRCKWGEKDAQPLPQTEEDTPLFSLCWSCDAKMEGSVEVPPLQTENS